MKRIPPAVLLLLLLPVCTARAETGASSYLVLADPPTITLDWSKGNTQDVTLHGNRAFVFVNGWKGGIYRLILRQDTTGSRAVTWPTYVRCSGRTCPALTTTAGKADFASFFFDGTNYYLLGLAQNY